MVVEMGRPGTGAYFRDIEKVAMALAPLQPTFEAMNPVTQLMEIRKSERCEKMFLNEKVLSAIIEMKTKLERIPEFLQAIEKVAKEIDTVMSVGVASKCLPDGTLPARGMGEKGWLHPFAQRENQSGPGPPFIPGGLKP